MTDSEQELSIIAECARDFDPKDLGEWQAAFARMVREARAVNGIYAPMIAGLVQVHPMDTECCFPVYAGRAD